MAKKNVSIKISPISLLHGKQRGFIIYVFGKISNNFLKLTIAGETI